VAILRLLLWFVSIFFGQELVLLWNGTGFWEYYHIQIRICNFLLRCHIKNESNIWFIHWTKVCFLWVVIT
jgi:hypothetical protein